MEEVPEQGENVETLAVRTFLASRIQEINSLSNQISTTGGPSTKGLAFQHVPKHMRRRAVSHNPKRLPKRLQRVHLKQVEKSSGAVVKKPKRPSRKHRRRPSNLVKEYNRRQRQNKWMETHIWHAKRFHMENKWGYRIPVSPTDKGYRAGYKGVRRHCVMRDISYYSCLYLKGEKSLLCDKLRGLVPKEANLLGGVDSVFVKGGGREGVLHLYKKNSYPFGYMGKARFYWELGKKEETVSGIYFWTHPAIMNELVGELCSEFELVSTGGLNFSRSSSGSEKMETECEEEGQFPEMLEPKKLRDRPKWKNYESEVELTDMGGMSNRFRLYGPLATATLKEALSVLSSKKFDECVGVDENQKVQWWWKFYADKGAPLAMQEEIWKKLCELGQLPCGVVLPLTVNDPRVIIPVAKGVVEGATLPGQAEDLTDLVSRYQSSLRDEGRGFPIYDEGVREKVICEKMSQADFNNRRSQLLIPGSKLVLGAEENQVPILLINRSNSLPKGFQDGGWDLIVPAGWAMPFWIALVYRSVRVVGLREARTFECELGSSMQSKEDGWLAPDSHAGELDDDIEAQSLSANYFKYPPAKRTSFIKFRCPFPFKIDWNVLLRYNSTPTDDSNYYVLRDPSLLDQLSLAINGGASNFNSDTINNQNYCLVEVRVTILGKGSLSAGAVICIPTEDDLREFNGQLEEPLYDDSEVHDQRREMTNHRDRIKHFLQKKRRKLRKQKESGKDVDSVLPKYSSENLNVVNEAINQLWIPNSEHVLQNLSRYPIGAVVIGREVYSLAKCAGIGYCSLSGIKKWLSTIADNPQRFVLVRNCRDSLVYRKAKLEILGGLGFN